MSILFLDYLFRTILVIDIFLAIASFIFAYILLFRRDRKNPIYFNFGMAVLSMGLWAMDIIVLFFWPLLFKLNNIFFINLSFLFGILTLHYFLIFSIYFPFKNVKIKNKIRLLYIFTTIIGISIFIPRLYTLGSSYNFPFYNVYFNMMGLSIFTAYFIFLSTFAIKNLYGKYLISDGIHKLYLKKIILGTIVALLVNFILSLSIYFFININVTPFGALFTSVVLFYIYSILFSRRQV